MNDTEDSLKIIAKGAFIVLIGMLFSKIITYIYRIVIARIGPEEYGSFSIALAIFGVITTISILGLNNGILRYIPHYRTISKNNLVRKLISFSLGITFGVGIFFSSILFYFSEQISIYFFHNPDLTILLKIVSLAIPFNILNNILFFIFRSFKQIKYEVYIKNIIENSNKLILTFILVYLLGEGIFGVSVAYVIPIFVTSIICLYILNKKIIPHKVLSSDPFPLKEILFYSLPLLFSTFLIMLLSWTDSFMLGYFMSSREVGIYNSALPTVQMLYVIPYAFSVLFLPLLSEIYVKSKKESFAGMYQISNKWILIINLLLFSFFILFPKEIIYYIFGKEYIEGGSALIILSIGFFINCTLNNTEDTLRLIKKTKLILLNSIIITVLNIFLNLLLIPRYGINGAAIATTTSFIFLIILVVTESFYFLKISPFNMKWINIFAAWAFSILIFIYLKYLFIKKIDFINLILMMLFFGLLYIFSLYISKSFQKEDFFVLKTVKEKIKVFFKNS